MKNFFSICFCCFLFISFRSEAQDADFVIPRNPDVTLIGDNGFKIIASDVYSKNSKLRRSIRLYDPKTNVLMGEAFLNLESNDPAVNMYEQLDQDPEKFSGFFSIESEGKLLYVKKFGGDEPGGVSGRAAGFLGGGPGPVYNPNVPCTFRTIHDCVAYRVENLTIWDMFWCLLRAPVCYAGHWLFCGNDVCNNKMQYTNPN